MSLLVYIAHTGRRLEAELSRFESSVCPLSSNVSTDRNTGWTIYKNGSPSRAPFPGLGRCS